MVNNNVATTFSNGQHVACAGRDGKICAFYQNMSGTKTANQTAELITGLLSHGW
jgi:hypothetical protein